MLIMSKLLKLEKALQPRRQPERKREKIDFLLADSQLR